MQVEDGAPRLFMVVGVYGPAKSRVHLSVELDRAGAEEAAARLSLKPVPAALAKEGGKSFEVEEYARVGSALPAGLPAYGPGAGGLPAEAAAWAQSVVDDAGVRAGLEFVPDGWMPASDGAGVVFYARESAIRSQVKYALPPESEACDE